MRLCSTGKTTYHLKGASQVKIQFIDDKRQYTVGLAVSLTGKRLRGQIIFSGVSDRCHPKVLLSSSLSSSLIIEIIVIILKIRRVILIGRTAIAPLIGKM